ncbi:MAG: sulfoxide reductase heme-binding subunit YedZ [Pseudomonadota bacterium]|nr:MAG: sulfoxide reductase heme-binding subunit YedZ [Pseudomonadota bacterium]
MVERAVVGRAAKALAFVLCLVPFAWLLWRVAVNDLGTNPIETLNRYTGDWTLRFLLITLAVTPLRRLTGWLWLARWRRMIGLYAFFYATVHFLTYALIDQFFDFPAILQDIAKRPYITLGFACFVLLIPLAATSTNAMVRRLGGQRWQRLHRLVYVIAIGGVIHFLWLVKSDIREPLIYAAILTVLLGHRLYYRWRRNAVAAGVVTR